MTTRERQDLLETLDKHRGFLRFTARGLTDAQATQRTTASSLTIAGLIKHVAATEHAWLQFVVGGATAMGASVGDYEDQFTRLPDETLESLLERYEQVARETSEIVNKAARPGCRPSTARGALVRSGCTLVRAAGAAPHHRGDVAARRPRGHHPRVAGRLQDDGLSRSATVDRARVSAPEPLPGAGRLDKGCHVAAHQALRFGLWVSALLHAATG